MRLNQVTVPCLNIDASIAFYKKLGLELIVHSHDSYARFLCPEGDATFSLHRVEEKSKGPQPVIYFEINEVDEAYKKLKNLGIIFDFEPIEQPWLWKECGLKDPYGNEIILYTAGENRIHPPWRIKR